MSELKYIIRKNSSVEGKTGVYFCCHPQDLDVYLSEIADDILKYQDCAVWYNAAPFDDYDKNFFVDLAQMRLFVVPVTSRFLKEENRGLEEFRFALEKNIPVLPLLQEDGLTEIFNSVCGDLQYLYKNSDDPTAIGFETKLEKYLAAVLIGNELADKIRKMFDAYIFLSYRKKDRQYAQELMHLIHRNDFCRDIAIWYDEFLTPGENFNDAILSALKKSKLFVLTVTPNLINEKNYVMTTEYPMAKDMKKPILPIELVTTDGTKLSEIYEQLPPVVSAYDESLKQVLSESIKKLALTSHEKDAVHDFFIGLAYLGGIDVETDGKRAEELITSAASNGLCEAMEKLASMYSLGNGVPRDNDKALMWTARLCETLEEKYKAESSDQNLISLTAALFELGSLLAEMKLSKDAETVYKRVIGLCGEDVKAPDLCRILANTYLSLGGLEENRRQEYYEHREKEHKPVNGGDVYTITVIDDGNEMRRYISDWQRRCFALGAKYFRRCISSYNDPAYRGLIESYLRYAAVGIDDPALNSLGEERKIYLTVEDFCKKHNGFKDLLADVYLHLGKLMLKDARMHGRSASYYKKSGEYYSKAGLLLRELYTGGTASEKRKLIQADLDIVKYCLEAQETYDGNEKRYILDRKWLDTALRFCHRSEKASLELLSKTDAPCDRLLLGECYILRGLLLAISPENADREAKDAYLSAYDIFLQQLKISDTADVRLLLRDCCMELERLCISLGEAEEAARFSKTHSEISNYAIAKTPFRNRGLTMASEALFDESSSEDREADPDVLFGF